MKTIDEVIKALEICWEQGTCSKECPYMMEEPSCGLRRELDALHYLRLFQKHEERVRGQLDALKEEYRPNDPLTWDELRTMEGKPMWMELGLLRPRWYLIEGFNGNQMIGVDALSVRVPFYKEGIYTGGWQAFRKERG